MTVCGQCSRGIARLQTQHSPTGAAVGSYAHAQTTKQKKPEKPDWENDKTVMDAK